MALSKIQAESMNLADTFAFTGNGTGASDMVLLANINNTSVGATTFEWSMDYDDYNNFIILVDRIQGDNSDTTKSLEVEFKFNGSYGGGETNRYFIEGATGTAGTGRNYNTNGDGELFFGNQPSKYWSGIFKCINFRGLDRGLCKIIAEISGATANNNHGSFYMMTGLHSVRNHQITDLRINFSTGNVTAVQMDIYGIRRT